MVLSVKVRFSQLFSLLAWQLAGVTGVPLLSSTATEFLLVFPRWSSRSSCGDPLGVPLHTVHIWPWKRDLRRKIRTRDFDCPRSLEPEVTAAEMTSNFQRVL
jgi:hypothetical protein